MRSRSRFLTGVALATSLFTVLKLFGVIAWSWWWVCSPLILVAALILALMLLGTGRMMVLALALLAGVAIGATNRTAYVYSYEGQHLITFTNCLSVTRCTEDCKLVRWLDATGATNDFHAWAVVVRTNQP